MSMKDQTTITFALEVVVPKERIDKFTDFCMNYGDLLSLYYIGGWAKELARSKKRGVLIVDYHEVGNLDDDEEEEDKIKAATIAWRLGRKLPEHFYAITPDVCMKAFMEGIKWGGIEWEDNDLCDGYTYDDGFQRALFGENRYG